MTERKKVTDLLNKLYIKLGKETYGEGFITPFSSADKKKVLSNEKALKENAVSTRPEMPTPDVQTPRSEMPTPQSDAQTPLAPRIESRSREGDHLYATARPADYSGDNRPSLNELETSTGEIKNYYDDLPADLAEGMNYISPTFDRHLLKMQFRMLVVAPSGTGLFYIINILYR
jgi:hypothetical protein